MSKPRPDMPPFGEADLLDDPIELFAAWFERAVAEVPLAESVCLATVDADGAPDARMVLLKGFDERGFRFFTNEQSVKGEQLAARPAAALVFYWRELDRQVRIRGPGRAARRRRSPTSTSRPARGRAGSAPGRARRAGRSTAATSSTRGSPRSRPATPGDDVPRPPHWGGFRVVPEQIEFWQGQVGRLHDRFRYEREAGARAPETSWRWSRLAP